MNKIEAPQMVKLLGHVHVTKTAGSALNRAFNDALSQRHLHISQVVKSDVEQRKPHALVLNSTAYNFASNALYLSGHIPYRSMKLLNRQYIFTMLRDPRKRLFSHYSYYTTRVLKGLIQTSGSLSVGHDFYDYLESYNGSFTKFLLLDTCSHFRTLHTIPRQDFDVIRPEIVKSLSRFDDIYYCDLQATLDHITSKVNLPKIISKKVNESEENLPTIFLGSQHRFIEFMNKRSELDEYLIGVARSLFPSTFTEHSSTDEELLSYLTHRFDVKFVREI